ncbi:MAG: L-threonylcarbamoyladenylate synthase, partial [Turicibacter sp.]
MIYKMEEIHEVLPSIHVDDVIVFPTDTVYGIGASIHSDCAIHKIFEIKNRPSEKSLIVLCANISQIEEIVGPLPEAVAALVHHLMPGGLTLILETNIKMSDEITRGKKTIGVRIPDHSIALTLIEKMGPLATTSANVSGEASPTVIDES